MRTGGHGNDSLILLVPVGVGVFVGIMLFGGPAEAFSAINAIVGETARATMGIVRALFS